MKVLKCADAGLDCEHVMRAETEDSVMLQAQEHAVGVHQLDVTPELAATIKGLIKEE